MESKIEKKNYTTEIPEYQKLVKNKAICSENRYREKEKKGHKFMNDENKNKCYM